MNKLELRVQQHPGTIELNFEELNAALDARNWQNMRGLSLQKILQGYCKSRECIPAEIEKGY